MHYAIGEEIPANLFRGVEAVGGRIIILENGIKFASHSVNIQTGETFIAYNQILNIKKRNTLFIIPNGISVTAKDGKEYKFVVNNRTKLIEYLQNRGQFSV